MPQIEDLFTTSKVAAPGWSYVVDSGFDPSKAPINPTSRKRQRAGQTETEANTASELSLRHQTAVHRHFASLDRDNHKTQHIPVPKSRLAERRQTTNVKRILQSGKDFAYFLEEEEALLAQKGLATVVDSTAATKKPTQRPSKTPIARRKSLAPPDVSTPPDVTASEPPTEAPVADSISADPTTEPSREGSLMQPSVLASISESEIEALLSAPPLTYNMARSEAPPASDPRPRVFCEICGYWGRVKCLKCGSRVCSVACRDTHDESRCVKFYA